MKIKCNARVSPIAGSFFFIFALIVSNFPILFSDKRYWNFLFLNRYTLQCRATNFYSQGGPKMDTFLTSSFDQCWLRYHNGRRLLQFTFFLNRFSVLSRLLYLYKTKTSDNPSIFVTRRYSVAFAQLFA